jgi:hypothetical protein
MSWVSWVGNTDSISAEWRTQPEFDDWTEITWIIWLLLLDYSATGRIHLSYVEDEQSEITELQQGEQLDMLIAKAEEHLQNGDPPICTAGFSFHCESLIGGSTRRLLMNVHTTQAMANGYYQCMTSGPVSRSRPQNRGRPWFRTVPASFFRFRPVTAGSEFFLMKTAGCGSFRSVVGPSRFTAGTVNICHGFGRSRVARYLSRVRPVAGCVIRGR